MPKKYIEVADLVYHLQKNATIDSQPRAIRRAAKMAEKFAEMYPADVEEVKHGEWKEIIDEKEDLFFRQKFYCSACGEWNTYGMTAYCPKCGARMDGKNGKD